MQLQYRTNNAYDSIILVDDGAFVRSDWTVDPDVMLDFLDCSQHPDAWSDREGDSHKPDDYGSLVAIRHGYELSAPEPEKWIERVKFHIG